MPKLENLINSLTPQEAARSTADAVDTLAQIMSNAEAFQKQLDSMKSTIKRLQGEIVDLKKTPLTSAVADRLEAFEQQVSAIPTSVDFSSVNAAISEVGARIDSLISALDKIEIPEVKPPDLTPVLAAIDGKPTPEYDDSTVMGALAAIQEDVAALKEHETEPEEPGEWEFVIERRQGGAIRKVNAKQVK